MVKIIYNRLNFIKFFVNNIIFLLYNLYKKDNKILIMILQKKLQINIVMSNYN